MTSLVLPMPASPVTRRSPVPDSRWRRTAASSSRRPAIRPGAVRLVRPLVAAGEPELVELGGVAVHRLDEELEHAPAGQPGGGEDVRHGGVAAAGLAREGAQARPASAVVEVVERVEEVPLGSRRDVGPRESSHVRPSGTDAVTCPASSRGRSGVHGFRDRCQSLSTVVNRGSGGSTLVTPGPTTRPKTKEKLMNLNYHQPDRGGRPRNGHRSRRHRLRQCRR